ncbi:hypothetical protein ACN4EG_04400 [Alkalinema pantanalense CENA528]|uniref:hypothetical protein n=1 Tax=Alkalinema pantanalense TaxID=1620705 RepID=UPI003D6E99D8
MGEFALWEKLGTGLGAFPWISVSFHGLLDRLLGIHSFWVADGLITIAYYSLMLLVLQGFGLGRRWGNRGGGIADYGGDWWIIHRDF